AKHRAAPAAGPEMNTPAATLPERSRAGLIAGSLVVNVALFGVLAWQPSLSPPAFRDFFRRNFHVHESATTTAAPPRPTVAAAATAASTWTGLKTDDLPALVARLRAAGFPAGVIREILRAQVNARYNPRLSALMEPDPGLPFWKVSPYDSGSDTKRREEI